MTITTELTKNEFEVLKAFYLNCIKKYYVTSLDDSYTVVNNLHKSVNVYFGITCDKELVKKNLISKWGLDEYFDILNIHNYHGNHAPIYEIGLIKYDENLVSFFKLKNWL